MKNIAQNTKLYADFQPRAPSAFSSRYVLTMITAARAKVSASETGMEYSTPSSPKNTGSSSAKPTPNTTSRNMDSSVDASALPTACRKMKHALFTQADTIRQRYTRNAFTANSV